MDQVDQLLEILSKNAELNDEQLGAMLGLGASDVRAAKEKLAEDGILRGYRALVDWERAGSEQVTAHIRLKVLPQKHFGFDEIAQQIASYPEVDSVYLMSGGCDISLTMTGKSFRDVALFVAHRLAPMEVVQSTETGFVLHTYKDGGLSFAKEKEDEREVTCL